MAMNLDSKNIALKEWMMSLMRTRNSERRNAQSGVGVSTPHGQKLEKR